jgi:hypothetical protein
MKTTLTEIPVGGMCMKDTVEMLGKLSNIGYEANIKSKHGRIVIQLNKPNA